MRIGTFEITELDPNPPDVNPFLYDLCHMGTPIGNNVWVMYMSYPDTQTEYLIIVNQDTGERIKVRFNQKEESK